jgi:hypothetical protein
MPNVHDVAIFHEVFFSFQAQQSFFLESLHCPVFHEVVIMTDFRANKVILKIGVNDAGRALRVRAVRDRPGAAFFLADGKE